MPRLFLMLILCGLVGVLSPSRAAPATDGSWEKLLPPTGRTDHTAIYDPVRHRMVVFGGYRRDAPTHMNDVWELSLDEDPTWTELTPSGAPPSGRRNHTAIYDPVRDRMIVFGGFVASPPYYQNDVWALSLGPSPEWTQLIPSGTPPGGRRSHTAVYDPVRDRVIIYGGYVDGSPNYRGDVWALSLEPNPAWTEIVPSGTPPSARAEHAAIYDPGQDRMVVIGGSDGTYRNDAWALTLGPSPAWTEIVPSGSPPTPRAEHTAIYDPVQERILVFGEWDNQFALVNEVASLSLAGSPSWTELAPTGTRTSGRWGHTAVYDPVDGRMIVFGGFPNFANDVWAFSLSGSAQWDELEPLVTAPAGRWYHPAIYDPIRDRMVVSGGYPQNVHDVWTLSLGGQPVWTRLTPAGTPPTGRKNHTAIYDPIRDRMVIFGGFLTYPDSVGMLLYQNDVWALSLGESPAWTEIVPTGTLPGTRDEHSAIYDPIQDRMIVFGGHAGSHNYNDVWALSLGAEPAWTQLFPAGTPPVPRRRHNGILDPLRNQMVVFGGFDTAELSCLNDVWTLSLGENPEWTELFPTGTPPSARGRQAAIHDPIRDRMVMSGGYDCSPRFKNDVWELSLGSSPAWTQLLPPETPPGVRGGHSTIYDPIRDRMVLFGGAGPYHYNDVWTLTWGANSCAIPEIVSYAPSFLTSTNCGGGCVVDFTIDTQDDYSGVTKITLERYREGSWIPEDSLLAPLPAPEWTLSCEFDEHFTDGEHVFRAVFHCADGSKGLSGTATVIADRGVPVGIQGFEAEYSEDAIFLRWRVADGAGFRGFNVYRSDSRETGFERINVEVISANHGNEYADRDVSSGTTYWYRIGAVYDDGEWLSPTVSITVPALSPALYQNVPNPFNPTTSISFAVPARSRVTLRIYDVAGRHVKTLLDDDVDGGVRNVVWDGRDERGNRVGSGVYFYEMRTANTVLTRTMVHLK